MKTNILTLRLLIALAVFQLPTLGLQLSKLSAQTAPKWAEKAKTAVFSVITYNAEGKILGTGNGFYISADGTAVSDFSLFKGAERATVVTADGRELPVDYIMGANDMFDVVKFKTASPGKAVALDPAFSAPAVGETVYLLPYSTQKSATLQSGTVTRIDTISSGTAFYYTLELQTADKNISCPVMNAGGQVIGMIQKSASSDSKESYCLGTGYFSTLAISAFAGSNSALDAIGIKKGLPEDESQAQVYLYMNSSRLDNEQYLALLNDFIAKYPNNPDGYQRRAACYMSYGDDSHNALADADLKRILSVSDKKQEGLYNVAKLIFAYSRALTPDQQPYTGWGLENALDNIRAAIKIDPQPTYRQTEAEILFAMQNYSEAYQSYLQVCQSSISSSESFYSAAVSLEMSIDAESDQSGAEMEQVLALVDSAVVRFTPPYGKEAAPYLYERGRVKTQLGKHREAVADFNDFYSAMLGQVLPEFYVTREQAEMQCRMFKQALDDINKAVELEPDNTDYLLEKASVHLRVNQVSEAVTSLRDVITRDSENAYAYRMLGYCLIQQGDKDEGLQQLQRAADLGDENAVTLIEKYK